MNPPVALLSRKWTGCASASRARAPYTPLDCYGLGLGWSDSRSFKWSSGMRLSASRRVSGNGGAALVVEVDSQTGLGAWVEADLRPCQQQTQLKSRSRQVATRGFRQSRK